MHTLYEMQPNLKGIDNVCTRNNIFGFTHLDTLGAFYEDFAKDSKRYKFKKRVLYDVGVKSR